MLADTLSGASYNWTQTGAGGTHVLGVGAGAITWTPAIPCIDVEQLGVLIQHAGTNNVVMRMQFGSQDDSPQWVNECVEEIGAIVAGAQRYDLYIKEWGPLAPGAAFHVSRPVDAHQVRIGFYAVGAVAANDTVTLEIERQSTSAQLGVGV